MNEEPTPVERRVLAALRAAREPVREAALHDRLAREEPLDPNLLIAALEKLATQGHVRMSVEHDRPLVHDVPPFEPRYWRVVD
jgi:hypothetical protein